MKQKFFVFFVSLKSYMKYTAEHFNSNECMTYVKIIRISQVLSSRLKKQLLCCITFSVLTFYDSNLKESACTIYVTFVYESKCYLFCTLFIWVKAILEHLK